MLSSRGSGWAIQTLVVSLPLMRSHDMHGGFERFSQGRDFFFPLSSVLHDCNIFWHNNTAMKVGRSDMDNCSRSQ